MRNLVIYREGKEIEKKANRLPLKRDARKIICSEKMEMPN